MICSARPHLLASAAGRQPRVALPCLFSGGRARRRALAGTGARSPGNGSGGRMGELPREPEAFFFSRVAFCLKGCPILADGPLFEGNPVSSVVRG